MVMTRRYLNFVTRRGVDLTRVAKTGLSSFLIHECGYLRRHTGWNHPAVDSPFWRFYHNPTPGWHIRHRGRNIPLRSSEVMLIPEDTLFDCCGPKAASHLWIHFSVTRHAALTLDVPAVLRIDSTIRPLLREVLALHRKSILPVRDQRMYHAVAALLHASFGKIEAPLTASRPDALHEVLAFINGMPNADLSNAALARRAGMSVERFIRWFREHVGITPANYVSSARVRLAREALALTEDSIEQIADKLGFPNRFYFSRVFGRQVGCGPAEFRRRHRKEVRVRSV